jgi:hypothetical protein
MTRVETTATRGATTRPTPVKIALVILVFLGVTALAGGMEMLVFPHGNVYLPEDMLDRLPVDTFVLPGLILGVVFGLGSLFVAWGMMRRAEIGWLAGLERVTGRHWSWAGLLMVGLGFTTWLIVEVALLGTPWAQADSSGETSAWVLYGIYGSLALGLLVLPHLRGVKGFLRVSDR